jgi:predicted TIM-barrel fold metal-dependent hydrolase
MVELSATGGRIDVQHHILPPDYVAIAGPDRIGKLMVSGKTPPWDPETSLAAMDRHGIATAVMSVSAPGVWFGEPGQAREPARHCNEYAASLRRDHPGRFGFFATLPMPDLPGTLAELSYAMDVLGADGVCLMSNYEGRYLGAPTFRPLFEELDRRGVVVALHPDASPASPGLETLPAASLEFPFDTTRAVASLLVSGVLSACPRLRLIVPHAGGTLPFLAHRLARLENRPDLVRAVPDGVLATLRRLHFDVALSAHPSTLRPLLDFVPPRQILFASDFPFAGEKAMAETGAGLRQVGLAQSDLEAIDRGNALALMPGLQTAA